MNRNKTFYVLFALILCSIQDTQALFAQASAICEKGWRTINVQCSPRVCQRLFTAAGVLTAIGLGHSAITKYYIDQRRTTKHFLATPSLAQRILNEKQDEFTLLSIYFSKVFEEKGVDINQVHLGYYPDYPEIMVAVSSTPDDKCVFFFSENLRSFVSSCLTYFLEAERQRIGNPALRL